MKLGGIVFVSVNKVLLGNRQACSFTLVCGCFPSTGAELGGGSSTGVARGAPSTYLALHGKSFPTPRVASNPKSMAKELCDLGQVTSLVCFIGFYNKMLSLAYSRVF